MIYADSVIENKSIFLRNLNKNGASKDTWQTGTGYGWYFVPYEVNLIKDHYYYLRFTYKFTTTNLSPTWSQFYLESGMQGGPIIRNMTTGTEYTASGVQTPALSYTVSYGTLYNGDSNTISGVTSYAKNVLIYDVTDLFTVLRALNVAKTTDLLKTWCDNNLDYVPGCLNLDITNKIADLDKLDIYKGSLIGDKIVEGDGMIIYSNPSRFADTYFDNLATPYTYNNTGNGNVRISRGEWAELENSPFKREHKYLIKIENIGTAYPALGGFYTLHTARANAIFVEKFVAKIPVGYTVGTAWNSQGDGAKISMLSDNKGTGDWEEYTVLYKCGASGSFSSGGHIYLNGTAGTATNPVTWYLAYLNSCDVTNHPELLNYTIMPGKVNIKSGVTFTNQINLVNLLPNGDLSNLDSAMLPSGWLYDTTDYAGNSKCSLVQPVGAVTGTFGGCIRINPNCRYKISYWVKCKLDMTSYLTAIIPYTAGEVELGHTGVVYVPGTKTQLTAALNTGDTVVKVKSTANWKTNRAYGKLGFRSNLYSKSYNDLGTSNGNGSGCYIKSIDSSTLMTLTSAYTGSAKAANTTVVESYDGGTYPYPISKGNLPTNNTWKYVEGYFGANSVWDGSSSSGWAGLPYDCDKVMIRLNLFSNTGSVPIKYSDIRVECVAPAALRYENKIQINLKN